MKHVILIISISVIGVFPGVTFANGLSVSPSSVMIDTREHDTATLTVQNLGDKKASFSVYPDQHEASFSIIPGTFTLSENTSREVTVTVDSVTASVTETRLSVVARQVTPTGLSFGSGIKVPITVRKGGQQSQLAAGVLFADPIERATLGGLIALVLLVCIVAGVRYTKNKRRRFK